MQLQPKKLLLKIEIGRLCWQSKWHLLRAIDHLQAGGLPWVVPHHPLRLAVGETVILLQPPLPSLGVSAGMERGCLQNDSLADG